MATTFGGQKRFDTQTRYCFLPILKLNRLNGDTGSIKQNESTEQNEPIEQKYRNDKNNESIKQNESTQQNEPTKQFLTIAKNG